MTETCNIVILGCSFGGLGTAHYIAKHVLPKLQKSKDKKYALHLVDSSTKFWWHIAAPRQICSLEQITLEKSFVPIMDGFKQYTTLKDSIIFHHGTVMTLNKDTRSVTISRHDGGEENLSYYALVIATGVRSPTPATTFHGDSSISEKALLELNTKLASAKEVIISGGGPVGVETAGEVATHFAGKTKVTLVSGSNKLLPVFNDSRALKAQRLLEKVGVQVIHNAKVTAANEGSDGKTTLSLDNGQTLSCDVYVPAYGCVPNTQFLPDDLKAANGYVKTNPATLRVDDAGSRVYSAGDVAGVDNGGVLNMYNTLAVLGANIASDLLADAKAGNVAEKKYSFKKSETQFVPVGPKTGVAAFNGWSVPGLAVSLIKGKDYMIGQKEGFTQGKKF